MIYVDVVQRSLRDLPVSTLATRRELYEKLRAGLNDTLDSIEPPIDAKDKELEVRLLATTIKRLESDIRSGVDVCSEDYDPSDLEAVQARLYSFKSANRLTRLGGADGPSDRAGANGAAASDAESEALVARLRVEMARLSEGGNTGITHESPLALTTARALMLRKLRDVSTRSNLALLWLIVEPALYIGVVILIYTYMGRAAVLDMDVAPFAVTGVLTLLMFRQTMMRVAVTINSDVHLIAMPPVHLISVAFSQSAIIFLTFLPAAVLSLSLIVLFEYGPPPVDWESVLLIWMAICLFAASLGVILGYIATYVKVVTQTMAITFRFLTMTSGIFFVSEQFPQEYSMYLLWNPLLHGIQLLRSAYFASYKSTDASLYFFLCCVGATVAYATACERLARQRVEPA